MSKVHGASFAMARERELHSDDPEDRKYYAGQLAEFRGQLGLLQRRIASFTAEADVVEGDTVTIAQEVPAAMRTKDHKERRELLVGWIHEIQYAHGEAIITLRIPLKPVANCQRWGSPHWRKR